MSGAIMVWLDWHAGSANPAMPVNRATTISVVLLLAVLPWVFGAVADNRAARIIRACGYTSLYALLAVMVGLSRFAGSRFDHMEAVNQANWAADVRSGAVVSAVLVIAIVGGYAAAILAVTARRISGLTNGVGLGAATALVLYALMPLGDIAPPADKLLATGYVLVLVIVPPAALIAAGLFASGINRGAIVGLCAGATAALLLNILTVTTMLLLPGQVDLQWANPDPAAPHGTPFEVRMSVGDAAIKYEAGLLLGPLFGLALGAIGGGAERAPLQSIGWTSTRLPVGPAWNRRRRG